MPPRTRPAAATGALCASARQRPPPKISELLQAGLPSLAQPYSERAGAAVLDHLRAVKPLLLESRSTPKRNEQPRILELLNSYFGWFVSGMGPPSSEPPPAILSSSSSSSRTQDRSYLACGVKAFTSGVFVCCTYIDVILTPASKSAQTQPAAALLAPLTTSGTGEVPCQKQPHASIARPCDSTLPCPWHSCLRQDLCTWYRHATFTLPVGVAFSLDT
jgi:hypothetical protein